MTNVNNTSRLEAAKIVADSGRKQTQGDAFGKFAAGASGWLGSKWAFVGAIVIIAVGRSRARYFTTLTPGNLSSIRERQSSRF